MAYRPDGDPLAQIRPMIERLRHETPLQLLKNIPLGQGRVRLVVSRTFGSPRALSCAANWPNRSRELLPSDPLLSHVLLTLALLARSRPFRDRGDHPPDFSTSTSSSSRR